MIIIVIGLPGSGKSYFASGLAAALSIDYFNSDVERNKIMVRKTYSDVEKLQVYDHLLAQMRKAINENRNIVLDATFYKAAIREKFLIEAGLYPVVFIEIFASDEIIKRRLGTKRVDSDADYQVFQKISAEWEPLQADHLVMESTNENVKMMMAQAIDYLKKQGYDH